MSIITTERLTKILSETQAVITECSSRSVHGSVEVNARLFENVLMELLRHRAAMLQGVENGESATTMKTAPALDSSPKIDESPSGNSPVIPDGWVMVPVDATRAMIDAARRVEEDGYDAMHKAMIAAAPQQEA